jgi:hypothetical protein
MTSAKYVLSACLLIIFAQTLAGCAFLLSLDQEPRVRVMPSDSNAVIIGSAVKINSPQVTSREILFVKLEDGSDDLLQGQILPNTHFRFGYAFLPNAQPGRYAAIGCRLYTSGQYFSIHSTVLFNRALVTKLTRTIAPGTVTLLGNIVVRETIGRQEADFDDVQQHYFRELTGGKDIRTGKNGDILRFQQFLRAYDQSEARIES